MMTGKTVYVRWYDFQKKAEFLCKGEVVDNELWADKYKGMVQVRFMIPSLQAYICHPFLPEKVSEDVNDVPHDDCYLLYAKRKTAVSSKQPSEAWQAVQQFKHEHWDWSRGHLAADALDEFYEMWHDAVAAKLRYRGNPKHLYVPEWTSWNLVEPKPVAPVIDEAIKEAKELQHGCSIADERPAADEPAGKTAGVVVKPEERSSGTVARKKVTVTELCLFDW